MIFVNFEEALCRAFLIEVIFFVGEVFTNKVNFLLSSIQ